MYFLLRIMRTIKYVKYLELGLICLISSQLVKNRLQCRRPWFDSWVGKIPWRRERLPTPVFWPGECQGLYSPWGRKESDTTVRLLLTLSCSYWGFPGGSDGKESACNSGDPSSIPRLGISFGKGNSYPIQYSCQ